MRGMCLYLKPPVLFRPWMMVSGMFAFYGTDTSQVEKIVKTGALRARG